VFYSEPKQIVQAHTKKPGLSIFPNTAGCYFLLLEIHFNSAGEPNVWTGKGVDLMKKTYLVSGMLFFSAGICSVYGYFDETEELLLTVRMMTLVFQLGVILLAAKIGHILFEKIKLPGVLGELASGMIIGPFALGALPVPGFSAGLFPRVSGFPVSTELYGLSSVAAVVLLFMTGLETDFKMLSRFSFVGSMVGLGGVIVSFCLGAWATSHFSAVFMHNSIGIFSPTALFMGVISTATSVGITARLLSENRKLDTPEGVTTISGAVIDDVLGVIILTVVSAYISAPRHSGYVNWSSVGLIALKALTVWIGFTLTGLLIARNLSNLLKKLRNRYTITMMSLGLALILAALFEKSGLAMIIGAYVMGLSLSNTDIVNILTDKLESLYEFLIPVFFCVMGMFVNFRVFQSREILSFGIVFTLVAVAAKIIGCGLPAMILKFNVLGALRIGVGMIPRGEVALIMAGIGLTEGILNSRMMGVVILMTMLSTLMAPPALTALLKIEQKGFSKDEKSFSTPECAFTFSSVDVAKELVYRLVDVFKADGFIAHLLEKTRHIQLRRNGTVIGLRREQNRIIFTCQKEDFSYVTTAIIEVAAKLEHIAKLLRKPLHLESFINLTPPMCPGNLKMNLAHFISPAGIIPRLKGSTKTEIIDELLDKLEESAPAMDFKSIRRAVWLREKDMSTGMTNCIAIPHGHTDAIDDLRCVAGFKPEGVRFDSLDKKPARIFLLSVSPEHKPTPHTELMSTFMTAFDETRRNDILKLTSADDIHRYLRSLCQVT
jgi:Kef-type K+ transport system membrane component KefB/mannitol/fructose-specific phosphotransferase system IIA component (Ntr-type)